MEIDSLPDGFQELNLSLIWMSARFGLSKKIYSEIKTTFLFLCIGFALSPVLYKLTDTIR